MEVCTLSKFKLNLITCCIAQLNLMYKARHWIRLGLPINVMLCACSYKKGYEVTLCRVVMFTVQRTSWFSIYFIDIWSWLYAHLPFAVLNMNNFYSFINLGIFFSFVRTKHATCHSLAVGYTTTVDCKAPLEIYPLTFERATVVA